MSSKILRILKIKCKKSNYFIDDFFINRYMNYEFKSVLFLGVGGISMHQLALALKSMGVKVFGYDLHKGKYTKLCEDNGIKVVYRFDKDICNVDLCVKTGAVNNSKYIKYLKDLNCPIIDRAEMLGGLCNKFKKVIAIAGTHGKSTTASLIYEILRVAGKKVSCHIGAEVFAPRFALGDDYLIVEACEYNKSFLSLFPYISVVTNIEREHMDCYGNLFNLQSAFVTFLKRGNQRFVYLDNSTTFLKKYKNINFVGLTNLNFFTKLKGEHNMKNISLAVAVCRSLGIGDEIIKKGIKTFGGIPRRYECIGKFNNAKVYIDYAHHPTEIDAFLKTFNSEFKHNQIIFQPHTYSRTKTFFTDFISVLSKVENLIIYKEYSAREKEIVGATAKDLFLEIQKLNSKVIYCENFKSVFKNLLPNHTLAFVGAGDINLIADKLVKCKNSTTTS